ncbi:DUF3263 domain-containing protein [Williamsia sp. DF01-3]|uniref:DUF3263 domain-containing protein n=1 Tax=Williamsia sp. DF01-3 TaxID=2934157 RepID=UPI001FF2D2E2|nr:DUF3263 domain-containing protein [Williamsia sp. DF01-3]MCK0516027.1 DUF3263 domain-containing protein [Williamsia sp. DF01-3]
MTTLSNIPPDEVERMLDFARRWYPYGGGSADDILVEFGIGERDYFERLTDVLDTDQAGGHDQSVVTAIRQVCTRRLA